MSLNTLPLNTIIANEVAAAQATSSSLLDFSPGSVLLALIQADAMGIGLFLQGQNVYIASIARAATSNGADLDSFMADFGLTRLPATYATGSVTFSRATTTSQAVIPVGAQIQTTNGSQTYTVILDTTNAAYNAALNGYVITVSTSSVTVTVNANNSGTQGNAIVNAINVITTPIAYVDSVTNASAFTNALNVETDAAFRIRFVSFLGSLSKATLAAINFAVQGVQGVLDWTVTQNYAYNGSAQIGYFYVVVDDGTGDPSGTLISNVSNAVNAVVGATITFGVFAPVIEDATVVLTATAASGYTHSEIAASITTAVTNYINGLSLGETLYYNRIIQVAYDSSPGILTLSSLTLNGSTADLTITAQEVAKLISLTIN